METTWIFPPSKLVRKSMWKRCGFFDQQNYIEKVCHVVEIRRNLAFDVSTYYPCQIEIDSTWSARWVLILASAITGCVSLSAFASLLGVPIRIRFCNRIKTLGNNCSN